MPTGVWLLLFAISTLLVIAGTTKKKLATVAAAVCGAVIFGVLTSYAGGLPQAPPVAETSQTGEAP